MLPMATLTAFVAASTFPVNVTLGTVMLDAVTGSVHVNGTVHAISFPFDNIAALK
jgi:hypothetical protein